MTHLNNVLSRLAVAIGGIVLGMLTIEIGLRFVPEASWKGIISKNPTRYVLFKADKTIGWVHVPNARTTWQGTGEFSVQVQINSLGLRDREHTYDKPSGTFRILVLGDSFTEGMQVPLEQVFPVRLEGCLATRTGRKIEVINAGTSGYAPGDELLFFTHEGVRYNPDLVLVAVYTHNDVRDMVHAIDDSMMQSFGGYQFYLHEGHLNQRWVEWTEPDYEIPPLEHLMRRYSILYYILEAPDSTVRRKLDKMMAGWWPWPSSPAPVAQPSDLPPYAYDTSLTIFASGFPDNPIVPQRMKELWELFKAAFLELRTETAAHGAHLAVVIIPRDAQVHKAIYDQWVSKYMDKYGSLDGTTWDMSAPNKAISGFLTEHDIPTLDLMPGLQAYAKTHDDLLYFREDTHFTEKGHELAADLMCSWLVEDGLVPLADAALSTPVQRAD